MYGAIIGDIVGSRFEFDQGRKTREFELFTKDCNFTDDTVMTTAVAEALMNAGKDACEEEVKTELIRSMKEWGQAYPHAGYGARFIGWVLSDDPHPYGSYGNGSAMRVSPAGWFYDTIERTREVARWTAEVTHNHPEGIKGAESTAAAIFLARTGASKDEIEDYLVTEFGYDLTRTLDDIRPTYYHVEDCMRTMPEAFECFLEAESYEETLRNVMYIGGDTDTLCAIAGAVAEAFWHIPMAIVIDAAEYIPKDIEAVITRFKETVSGPSETDDEYFRNNSIRDAVLRFRESHDEEDVVRILAALVDRINEDGHVPSPMDDVNNVLADLDLNDMSLGGNFSLDKELRLRLTHLIDDEGKHWIPLFTDTEEVEKNAISNLIINAPIRMVVENAYYAEDIEGMVINPFGELIKLPKDILAIIVKKTGGKKGE
ncbi:MAG: ADP-ribosylglycohydrolase family protein [Clostridiales bacterium]|nr:ADP-ribosylglycohydrolase family protein [Clostridiales bacterium]